LLDTDPFAIAIAESNREHGLARGSCNDCGGKSWVSDGTGLCLKCYQRQTDARDAAEREAERVAKIPLMLPPRYRWCRFDAPELATRVRARRAIAAMQKCVEDRAPLVTLTGPPGEGKTVLAACALMSHAYQRPAPPCMFVEAIALGGARREQGFEAERPNGLIARARQVDVLVLDDVAQATGEPNFIVDTIVDIVSHRHANELTTYCTTGRDEAGIEAYGGGGLRRRMFEGCTIRLGGAK
jgi:hypothetical protein